MKLIVANWKMNVPDLRRWRNLRIPKNIDAVICPPFPYIPSVKNQTAKARLGAQNCFWEEKGAYTGEVSPAMLKSFGVQYAIIGHSERRRWLRETDEMINKKVLASLRAGLSVILCVGEPSAIRRRGLSAAKHFVENQLNKDLKGMAGLKIKNMGFKIIIAYEPVWAIGTGRADKPEDSASMANFIKKILDNKFSVSNPGVLYGGSVTGKNAANFLKLGSIDGALVGGASLKRREFEKILKVVSKLH